MDGPMESNGLNRRAVPNEERRVRGVRSCTWEYIRDIKGGGGGSDSPGQSMRAGYRCAGEMLSRVSFGSNAFFGFI